MGRWVGQKMALKMGYPLWMVPIRTFVFSYVLADSDKDRTFEFERPYFFSYDQKSR